jgi:caffeoyl-CoA O-methyltransferase
MSLEQEAYHVYASKYSRIVSDRVAGVLADLERATHLRVLSPQMLSGYLQGQWLALFSAIIAPKLVVEIGTFTGYSAICLAQGLAEGGVLHTIEYDEELESIIREYIARAALEEQVKLHIGDAKILLSTLPDEIDLAFIDADKLAYMGYYEAILPKMRKGGCIVIDNVLWHGKVLQADTKDTKTKALQEFVQHIQADERVNNFLMPLRDGLMIVRKI